MPDLTDKAKGFLGERLYAEASIANPIDVLATANAGHWRAATDALLEEDQIDSIYINFVTPPFVDCEAVAREMAEVSNMKKKPVICNYMTDKPQWTETTAILKSGGIPMYDFPEMAAKSLAAMVRYNNIRNRRTADTTIFSDVDSSRVSEIINSAKETGREILNAEEVYEILENYGLRVAANELCKTIDDAVQAAENIGYPVVLKADSKSVIHKSDQGGVALNLKNQDEFRKAAAKMKDKLAAEDLQFFVQKFMPGGKEVIIGATKEPGLGHMVMFGMGGIFVELLKDVAFEITPVTRPEAEDMVSSIKTAKILQGFRGDKGADIPKLTEMLQRVSQLVAEHPEIIEMDLNPVAAFADSCFVVDARIKI